MASQDYVCGGGKNQQNMKCVKRRFLCGLVVWVVSMESVLRFLDTVDLGGMFILVLALLFLGNKLSEGHSRVRALCFSLSGILFVAYVVFQITKGSMYSDNLAEVTFRGLLGAGFVLGASWILLVPIAVLHRKTADRLREWKNDLRRRRVERNRLCQAEEMRRRREQEYPAALREQEKRRKQAEEQARTAAEALRKREESRARCELTFALHGPEIRDRFSKEMFDDFSTRHLGDDRSPEYVEQRARELCDILQKHLEKAKGSAKDLGELAAARQEVQAFYDQHAGMLQEVCPPIRLRAELHARIPDTVTPQAAWKEASNLIAELLQLVGQERQKQNARTSPARPINPPMKNV
jgi:hypothetical protein